MQSIGKLTPQIMSAIRDSIDDVLLGFVKSGNYGPLSVKKLFLQVADELVNSHIIVRPEYLGGTRSGGQEFSQLTNGNQPNFFPDYEIPREIAGFIRQTIWELFIQGILSPATQVPHNIHSKETWIYLDAFNITTYGLLLLTDTTNRIRVYDPDRYLHNFTNANPSPDPEMMRYLDECISVFRGRHLLATVILLAIASERLIEQLAERLRDALGSNGVEWYEHKFSNKRDILQRFQSLAAKLMGEYGDKLGEAKLKEGFQSVVTLSFETIRLARNDIAHLAGREFTWNEVSGLLHNYVQYFLYVNRIIAFLANTPKSK